MRIEPRVEVCVFLGDISEDVGIGDDRIAGVLEPGEMILDGHAVVRDGVRAALGDGWLHRNSGTRGRKWYDWYVLN